MECECPYCGSTYDAPEIKVDLSTNRVHLNGDKTGIRVMPVAAELGQILLDAYPDAVTMDRLVARIYGIGGGPNGPEITIRQYISRLRKALRETPWLVECASIRQGGRATYRLRRELAA